MKFRQKQQTRSTGGCITPADGAIDWRWSAADVRNLVRAVTDPYPGAFTFVRGVPSRRVTIWWADHDEVRAPRLRAPGTVERHGGHFLVNCGDGRRLRLARFECEGELNDGDFLGVEAELG